jgi:hypothetical protein
MVSDTPPYGKSTSQPAAVLSFCRLRMEFAKATDLFLALLLSSGNKTEPFCYQNNNNMKTRTTAGFLTAVRPGLGQVPLRLGKTIVRAAKT